MAAGLVAPEAPLGPVRTVACAVMQKGLAYTVQPRLTDGGSSGGLTDGGSSGGFVAYLWARWGERGARPGPSRVAGAEPPEGGPLIGATRQQRVSIVVTNPFAWSSGKRVVRRKATDGRGAGCPRSPSGASPSQF
ncbi:hypothetical protein CCM_07298 [Cordyceps militaris CM01]|uniref:Uncharacterized protein n=1 Tax=Cordyceps militaris (strain CM01) TaxID=983644 RepID=G3JMQ2_CORMM|nr:uncharacterized protein CCM_07298 [Cordyceps militaris CM01]EGX90878.1 hypothetical protein CCM_07298 [Cordyceps militaris CM01]